MTPYNSSPPSVAGSDTSEAAAESMRPHTARIRSLVHSIIALRPVYGRTCDEVEWEASLSHQTASARIRELYLLGQIEYMRDGEGKPVRRKTRSGRLAHVYVTREGKA